MQVRGVDELFSIWLGSVGGNAIFPSQRSAESSRGAGRRRRRGPRSGSGARIADFRSRRIEAEREDGEVVTLRFGANECQCRGPGRRHRSGREEAALTEAGEESGDRPRPPRGLPPHPDFLPSRHGPSESRWWRAGRDSTWPTPAAVQA